MPRGLISLALLTSTLGLGTEFASAGSLSITHRPPYTIAPHADLTITFSVSGVCDGFSESEADFCEPISAGIYYSVGTINSVEREAQLSVSERAVLGRGSRTATVTIPGADLLPGNSLTYELYAKQDRHNTNTDVSLYAYDNCYAPLDGSRLCPSLGLSSYEHEFGAVWGPKTFFISGDPSPNAPTAPTLSVDEHQGGRVNLSWTAPPPNGAPVSRYKLYRAEGQYDHDLEWIAWTDSSQTNLSQWLSPGTFQYAVAAVNSHGEGWRSNTISVQVGVPDLVVTDVHISPFAPGPNDDITLHATVRNVGDAEAPSSSTSFMRSSGAGQWLLPTDGIPAGGRVNVSLKSAILTSQLSKGYYRLEATADYYSQVSEINESNNVGSASFAIAAPDFNMSTIKPSATVQRGEEARYQIAIRRAGGLTEPVTLSASGLPAGTTATFTPNPATESSELIVSTSDITRRGTTLFTITGVAGTISHSLTGTIDVLTPLAPDFSLQPKDLSLNVTQGRTANASIAIERVDGFAERVALSVTGLPEGVSATFSPPSATGNSSLLGISAAPAASPGRYRFTIVGTAPSLTRSLDATLVVGRFESKSYVSTGFEFALLTGYSFGHDFTLLTCQKGGVGGVCFSILPGDEHLIANLDANSDSRACGVWRFLDEAQNPIPQFSGGPDYDLSCDSTYGGSPYQEESALLNTSIPEGARHLQVFPQSGAGYVDVTIYS